MGSRGASKVCWRNSAARSRRKEGGLGAANAGARAAEVDFGPPKRREERAKLLATFLSNLAAAAMIAGLIAPSFTVGSTWGDGVAAILAGLVLHLAGQRVLYYVVEDEVEPLP